MANPLVLQGTLNRIRASITVPLFPQLNITASYLGREGISFATEGETTTTIPTMTGVVQSPEPYQLTRMTAHLLRSQSLAALWEAQRIAVALIGVVVLIPDSSNLLPYTFTNCAIRNVAELRVNGDNADYALELTGIYNINVVLWSGATLPGS